MPGRSQRRRFTLAVFEGGSDGHAPFGSESTAASWLPTVEAFLKELGLAQGR